MFKQGECWFILWAIIEVFAAQAFVVGLGDNKERD